MIPIKHSETDNCLNDVYLFYFLADNKEAAKLQLSPCIFFS